MGEYTSGYSDRSLTGVSPPRYLASCGNGANCLDAQVFQVAAHSSHPFSDLFLKSYGQEYLASKFILERNIQITDLLAQINTMKHHTAVKY